MTRDILYGRGYSSDEDAEQNQHASEWEEAEQAERMTTEAQASTSTSAEPPPNAPGGGGAKAQPQPPRDLDVIPPLPTSLGPMDRCCMPTSTMKAQGVSPTSLERGSRSRRMS